MAIFEERAAAERELAALKHKVRELVSWLEGGDDYDVEWFVIEHHMAEPTEREIGQGRNITEALLVAFHGLTEDDLVETMPDYDPMAHSS